MKHKSTLGVVAASTLLSLVLVATPSGAAQEPESALLSEVAEDGAESIFGNGHIELRYTESSEEVTGAALQTRAGRIDCVLTVNHPHASHHVRGNINVQSVTTCTGGAPASMRSATSLKMGTKTSLGDEVTKLYKSQIKSNSAVSCDRWGPGYYQGGAYTSVVLPPGYILDGPPMIHGASAKVWLACGPQPSRHEDEVATVVEFSFIREDLIVDH